MKHIALGVLLTVATLLVGTNMATAQTAQSCYVFNNDLSQGMTFGEVLELQKFLASEGSFVADVNGTFGPLTKAALARYQSKNGILATGYFGPATRAQVNARCGEVLGAYDQLSASDTQVAPATSSGTLQLLTPASGETWQISNNHTISWSPNPESSSVEAFLETKKGKVFTKIAQIIPCAKGSIVWCGDIDKNLANGVSYHDSRDWSPVTPGNYYVSIVDRATGQTDRTRNPIKMVKYGEAIRLKASVHSDKNKKVELREDNTEVSLRERKVVLSWQAVTGSTCTVVVSPQNKGDLVTYSGLGRHMTKRSFDLPGTDTEYGIKVFCEKGQNQQVKYLGVTIDGTQKPERPLVNAVRDFRWAVNNTGTIIDFFFTVQAEDADFQVPSSRITPTSMGTAVISGPFLSLSTGDADTITPGSSYVVRDGDEATFRVRFTLAGENGAYGEIRMASVLGQGVPQELQVSPTATISLASAGGGVAGAFAANTATYGPYSAIAGLPDLKAGMTHEGVAVIQRFLNANGFVVSTTSGQPGSVGYEATYFGPATQRALTAYQASKGISSTGTFGPATRAAMASTQN